MVSEVMMTTPAYFILDKDGNIKPSHGLEWCNWFSNIDNRTIKVSDVGNFKISTTFYGMNHAVYYIDHYVDGIYPMFETAIFDGHSILDDTPQKHKTKEEALEYHDKMVDKYSKSILEYL